MLRDNQTVTIAHYHQKIQGIEVEFHSNAKTFAFPIFPIRQFDKAVTERLQDFYEQGGAILRRPLLAETLKIKPDIVEWDYTELTTKARLFLVSIKTSHGFFRGQKNRYSIVPESELSRKVKRLPAVPTGHKIECDQNNRRVRLVGKNAGTQGVGEWRAI